MEARPRSQIPTHLTLTEAAGKLASIAALAEAKHVAFHIERKSLRPLRSRPSRLQILAPDFLANVQHRELGFLPREVTAEPLNESVAEVVAAAGYIQTFP